MTTYYITRERCRKYDACYTDEESADLIPSEGAPVEDVLTAPIPWEDRYWALCYGSDIPDRILREHACWWARRRLAVVRYPDPCGMRAIEVSERYARGEATEGELIEVWDAARCASTSVWDVALCSARDAAWYEAWGAALCSDRYPVREAEYEIRVRNLLGRLASPPAYVSICKEYRQ